MLGYLPDRLEDVKPEEPVVVLCQTGSRSAIGVSVLQAGGVSRVANLEGGYQVWAAAKLPVEHNGHSRSRILP